MFFSYCPTKRIYGEQAVSGLCRDIPKTARIGLVASATAWKCNELKIELQHIQEQICYQKIFHNLGEPGFQDAVQLAICIQEVKVDLILCIGGGSIIDLCKAAAVMGMFQGDSLLKWQQLQSSSFDASAIELMVISTVPGTSSESNNAFVITNPEGYKTAFSKMRTFPKVMAFDPRWSKGLTERQLQLGLFDSLVHIAEQFIRPQSSDLTNDGLCIALMATLLDLHDRLVSGFFDDHDLTRFSRASSIIIDSATLGRGTSLDFVTHELAVFISAHIPLPHAATLACVFPYYLEYPGHEDYHHRFQKLMNQATLQVNSFREQHVLPTFNLREHIMRSELVPKNLKISRSTEFKDRIDLFIRDRSAFWSQKLVHVDVIRAILNQVLEHLSA